MVVAEVGLGVRVYHHCPLVLNKITSNNHVIDHILGLGMF